MLLEVYYKESWKFGFLITSRSNLGLNTEIVLKPEKTSILLIDSESHSFNACYYEKLSIYSTSLFFPWNNDLEVVNVEFLWRYF